MIASPNRSTGAAIDSTYVKVQRAAFGAGAGHRSLAWPADNKIHVLTDVVGRTYALVLSPESVAGKRSMIASASTNARDVTRSIQVTDCNNNAISTT